MLTYSEVVNPTDDRVKHILEAGEKHFKKHGFRRSSIGDICKDAGISKPTFYKYFDKKETLFFSVLIYLRRNWESEYQKRAEKLTTAQERFALFFQLNEEHQKSTPLLTRPFHHNSDLYRSWVGHPLNQEFYLDRVDFLEKILVEGISTDEFRISDPRRAAHVISLASSLISVFDPDLKENTRKTDSQFLFDLLFRGIIRRGPSFLEDD